MRIPAKANRTSNGDVDFEDYDWRGWKAPGWWRAVVLNVEETQTQKGADMLVITFGLANPYATGGRVDHRIGSYRWSGVEEVMTVFAPHLLNAEEDEELGEEHLRFRRCALLLKEGQERRDGKGFFWEVSKLLTIEQADEQLGEGWDKKVFDDEPEEEGEDEDGDFF